MFTIIPFWVVCSFVQCEGPSTFCLFVFCPPPPPPRGEFAFLPFLSSFLVYFLVNISVKFMFRSKAVVGGLGNNCCRFLFFMRSYLLCFGARRVIFGMGSGRELTFFCDVLVARCLCRGGFPLCCVAFSTDFFVLFF